MSDDRTDGPGASEAYIRRWLGTPETDANDEASIPASTHVSWWLIDGLRAVIADLDARRSLPVVRTCGACAWCGNLQCQHDGAPLADGGYPSVDISAPPPSWCPLRERAGKGER